MEEVVEVLTMFAVRGFLDISGDRIEGRIAFCCGRDTNGDTIVKGRKLGDSGGGGEVEER
jgi:hypothetical protein